MLKSRYFMKIDWNIFQERRCLYCSVPFFPKKFNSTYPSSIHSANTYTENLHTASTETDFKHSPNITEKSQNTSSRASEIETYISNNLCPDCAYHIREKTRGYCKNCGELLADPTIISSHCGQCENTQVFWDSLDFFAPYNSIFRELILKAKFNQNRACAKFLGKLLTLFLISRFPEEKFFNFIPMPLHEKRLRERGYNQCLEILKFSANSFKQYGIHTHIHKTILRKKFSTIPQSTLNKKARLTNIKNSFTIQDNKLAKQKFPVFLFDDIATTGSTLQEACKELKRNGFEKIHVIVLAKA